MYDMPDAMRSIVQDDLDNWGVTFYEAMEVAKENLKRLPQKFMGPEEGSGVYLSANGDNYDASRLLLVDLIRQFNLHGDAIAMAPTRGTLVVAGSDPITVPTADRAATQTALGNFVANAVRLAPRGSAIDVDWGELQGWAWIAVTDEGPGLPNRLHARVFERGWRGRHDRDRAGTNGSGGLGLTIARQVTEAQGGLVTLESEEGGGSTFALWLPLGHDAEAADILAADGVHPAVHPWRRDPIPS